MTQSGFSKSRVLWLGRGRVSLPGQRTTSRLHGFWCQSEKVQPGRRDGCGTTLAAVILSLESEIGLCRQIQDRGPRFSDVAFGLGSCSHRDKLNESSNLNSFETIIYSLHFLLDVLDSKQKPPRNPITSNSLRCECTFSMIITLKFWSQVSTVLLYWYVYGVGLCRLAAIVLVRH